MDDDLDRLDWGTHYPAKSAQLKIAVNWKTSAIGIFRALQDCGVCMTIRLDHTIVPAKDKVTSAKFFAEIFGLTAITNGHFAKVRINDSLTFDFADEREPRTGRGQHYAFHVSDEEFDAIFSRVKAKGIPCGSGPSSHTDGKINHRRGGRGFYFADPNGHMLEVMTVAETES